MAAEFPLRKEQLIFLINNYDMMLAVLMVSLQNKPKSISVALSCFFSKVIAGAFITVAKSAVSQKTEKKKKNTTKRPFMDLKNGIETSQV